ncbi:MAG: peptidoglycan-binding protein [Peptococcaceae bacterium]|nr:peptidoglycan-binding protein [Peptococcaceae bacterium]
MKKKIVACLLLAVLFSAIAVPVFAATEKFYVWTGYYWSVNTSVDKVGPHLPSNFRWINTGIVQRMLEMNAKLGKNIYPGPVDGLYGPLTKAAIRDYQYRNGLEVDGIVGPNTWASLGNRYRAWGQPSLSLRTIPLPGAAG